MKKSRVEKTPIIDDAQLVRPPEMTPSYPSLVDTTVHPQKAHRRRSVWRELFDWVKYLVIAVVLGLLINHFVLQRNEVVGHSMDPTLQTGDQLIVQKVSHWFNGIHRGDIVTLHGESIPGAKGALNEDLVKRVIGEPGDHVQIRDGKVWINGEVLEEPYLSGTIYTDVFDPRWADLKLKTDEYFVLGDNRTNSRDSRSFGPVPQKAIMGELWFRVYPFNRFGSVR